MASYVHAIKSSLYYIYVATPRQLRVVTLYMTMDKNMIATYLDMVWTSIIAVSWGLPHSALYSLVFVRCLCMHL